MSKMGKVSLETANFFHTQRCYKTELSVTGRELSLINVHVDLNLPNFPLYIDLLLKNVVGEASVWYRGPIS